MAAAPVQASPVYVDYGNDSVEFQYRFDVSKLATGDASKVHFSGDDFIDHVGIATADLFNPTNARITTNAVKGHYGVSAYHGVEGGDAGAGGDWLRTANRVPIRGDGIDSEHQHVTLPGSTHFTDLKLRPTMDQFEQRAKANNRKGISVWAKMKPDNVMAGTHISKVGGTKKYIVPEESADGTKNAMHIYIKRNAHDDEFMGGVFHPTRAKMTTDDVSGKQAYTVEDAVHFGAMKKVLNHLVETHSPYHRGLGMTVTKLDKLKDTEPLVVSIRFNRKPISKEHGFVPKEMDDAVAEGEMRRLVNGGADEPEMVTASGELIRVPGFEEELSKAQNPEELAASHSYVPYSEEADAVDDEL
jgi:hypothetical protein